MLITLSTAFECDIVFLNFFLQILSLVDLISRPSHTEMTKQNLVFCCGLVLYLTNLKSKSSNANVKQVKLILFFATLIFCQSLWSWAPLNLTTVSDTHIFTECVYVVHYLLHVYSRHQFVSSCSQDHLSIAVRTSYLLTPSSRPVNWTCATAPEVPDPFVFAEPSQNTLSNVDRQVESLTCGWLNSSVVS